MKTQAATALVYFNFRGMAQPIRIMLAYLEVPYYNVHLDEFQTQKKSLPPSLVSQVQSTEVNKSRLPMLLHEGRCICTIYQVLDYLGVRFGREDLMGINIQQRAIVAQIIELYSLFFECCVTEMFEAMERIADASQDQLLLTLEMFLAMMLDKVGYIKEICHYISMNPQQPSFIFNNLTLPDFKFIESTNYMLGMFGALCPELASEEWKERSGRYQARTWTINLLKQLKAYNEHFKSLPFYKRHKAEIERYTIMGFFSSERQRQALRRVWVGDMKLLQ